MERHSYYGEALLLLWRGININKNIIIIIIHTFSIALFPTVDFKEWISHTQVKSKGWLWGTSTWIHTDFFFLSRSPDHPNGPGDHVIILIVPDWSHWTALLHYDMQAVPSPSVVQQYIISNITSWWLAGMCADSNVTPWWLAGMCADSYLMMTCRQLHYPISEHCTAVRLLLPTAAETPFSVQAAHQWQFYIWWLQVSVLVGSSFTDHVNRMCFCKHQFLGQPACCRGGGRLFFCWR